MPSRESSRLQCEHHGDRSATAQVELVKLFGCLVVGFLSGIGSGLVDAENVIESQLRPSPLAVLMHLMVLSVASFSFSVALNRRIRSYGRRAELRSAQRRSGEACKCQAIEKGMAVEVLTVWTKQSTKH